MVLRPRSPSVLRTLYTAARFRADFVLNVVLVIIAIITEVLVSMYIFDCPCVPEDVSRDVYNQTVASERVHYGIAFIIWPASAFFCVGLLLSTNVHRCLLGTTAGFRGCVFLARGCGMCFLSSLAWLIAVLIDGSYIACTQTTLPTKCLEFHNGGADSSNYDVKLLILSNNSSLKARSQIAGCTILGLLLVIAFCGSCFSRLCGSSSYFEERHMHNFQQQEMESFDFVSTELSRIRLESQWRLFLTRADQSDWEDIADLPQKHPLRFNNRTFYSPLDIWSSGKGYKKYKGRPPVDFDDYESSDMTDSHTVTLNSDTTVDRQLASIPHKKRSLISATRANKQNENDNGSANQPNKDGAVENKPQLPESGEHIYLQKVPQGTVRLEQSESDQAQRVGLSTKEQSLPYTNSSVDNHMTPYDSGLQTSNLKNTYHGRLEAEGRNTDNCLHDERPSHSHAERPSSSSHVVLSPVEIGAENC